MEATTIIRLDYTVAVDGGPTQTFDTAIAAVEEAERVKRETPDALVTVIFARFGQSI